MCAYVRTHQWIVCKLQTLSLFFLLFLSLSPSPETLFGKEGIELRSCVGILRSQCLWQNLKWVMVFRYYESENLCFSLPSWLNESPKCTMWFVWANLTKWCYTIHPRRDDIHSLFIFCLVIYLYKNWVKGSTFVSIRFEFPFEPKKKKIKKK